MPDESFDALLARAREGDPGAMSELAKRYEPEVLAVARVRLGPALRPYLDTFDLVQSVHRSLIVGLRNNKFAFTGPEQLVALAVTIVRRKAARQWQRAQRQVRTSGTDSTPLPDVLVRLTAADADPAREAETRDTVGRVLGTLDGIDRDLLDLSIHGYRTVEIAEMLGQNPDVLRVRRAACGRSCGRVASPTAGCDGGLTCRLRAENADGSRRPKSLFLGLLTRLQLPPRRHLFRWRTKKQNALLVHRPGRRALEK
jgi:RNA polymerase sigma-70 factor (ECF subfamily)